MPVAGLTLDQRLPAGVRIGGEHHARLLADPHAGEFGLLEVGLDPRPARRHQREQEVAALTCSPCCRRRFTTTPSTGARTMVRAKLGFKVAQSTVDHHVVALLAKLGVSTRKQAALHPIVSALRGR